MKLYFNRVFTVVLLLVVLGGCSSNKQSPVNRFYHNTTGYYNAYWNAQQLVDNAEARLVESNIDDYTKLLSVFPYDNSINDNLVSADMDRAIEKTAKVNYYHEKSRWVDDTYVLMGKAQILKNDYVSAEKTLSYFEEAFDPTNPESRVYDTSIDREAERKKKSDARAEKKVQAEKKREERKRLKKQEEKKREEEKAKKKELDRQKAIKDRSERIKKKETRRKKSRKKKKRRKKSKKKKRRDKNVAFKTSTQNSNTKTQLPQRTTKVEKKKIISQPVVVENNQKREEPEVVVEDIPVDSAEDKFDKVYNRGRYFLAEAKARQGQYSEARYILSKLYQQREHDRFVRRNVPVLRSFIDVNDADYSSAKVNLESSIEESNSKKLKARYAFILGQIYSNENKHEKAYDYFKKAHKWAKSFELEFNADIRAKKAAYLSRSIAKDKIVKDLSKMARMDKYEEQQSTIYSTLADIYVKDGDLENAKKYLELSAKSKSSNPTIQKDAYYNLANLYYDNQNYVDAKLYLDSTLMVSDPKSLEISEIEEKRDNLEPIAKNIKTIMLNDSLIMMTKWSDDKIKKIAKDIVKLEDKKPDQQESVTSSSSFATPFKKDIAFPLYRQDSRNKGKKAFDKKWGRRPLVDNWRVKAVVDADLLQGGDEYLDKGDRINAEIARIKEQIPYSTTEKQKLYNETEVSFYELGKLYKLNIDELELSNDAFTRMLRLNKDSKYKAEAYYYMYLNHLALNNSSKAQKYANLLKEGFPDSKYTMYIVDTDKEPIMDAKSMYEKAYTSYESGDYAATELLTAQGMKKYADHPLGQKFELLNIMSQGAKVGKDKYITLLQNFKRKNPNSPEGLKAGALLSSLTGISQNETSSVEKVKYNLKLDTDHYVIVSTMDKKIKELTPFRTKLATFNRKKYAKDKLKISVSVIEENNLIMIVKNFSDGESAEKYLNKVKKSGMFKALKGNVEFFSISKFNYRRLKKAKNLSTYREFYETNYSF